MIKAILLGITLSLLSLTSGHICQHHKYANKNLSIYDELSPLITINAADLTSFRRLETDEDSENDDKGFSPIRIEFDYTTLDNQVEVDDNIRRSVKLVLEQTKESIQTLLKVERVKQPISINSCYTHVQVSDVIRTSGLKADLVIFPFIDIASQGPLEAYAAPCMISNRNNRPIAGYIAFTLKMDINKKNWSEYYTLLALHEISHILVFSNSLFDLFIDNKGNIIPKEQVYKKIEVNGVESTMITTPKVVQIAREYFDCPTLEGVLLENQGGEGTSLCHWEARIMLSDFMIGASYDEQAISEITLALFEDSGWYKANYYTGGLFKFGKGKGCDFVYSKCVKDSQTDYPNDFCTKKEDTICTSGRSSKGLCWMKEYDSSSSNDTRFSYFEDSRIRGGFKLTDFCPIAMVPMNEDYFFPMNCNIGKSIYPSTLQENISPTSSCFMSNFIRKNFLLVNTESNAGPIPICYSYDCNFEDYSIVVKVGESSVKCTKNGEKVTLKGYNGHLICPDFDIVCTNKEHCNSLVDCVKKRSERFSSLNIRNKTILPNATDSTDQLNDTSTLSNITYNQTYTNEEKNTTLNIPLTYSDSNYFYLNLLLMIILFTIVL